VIEEIEMTAHAFRNNDDPFRFIVRERYGIDIDAVAASGDVHRITHAQRLLDGLAEVHTMGFEDGERDAPIIDWPLADLVAELRTDFLLALHRNDAELREIIVAEIARRAGTGSDALVAFAPPLAEQAP
jgi:predicted mannosyl-3-phosphoglycerate phosphatase (HAD superfamily)